MPVVTNDLLKAVKAKGFKSIRIPMTAYTRYSLVNGHYVLDPKFLARYKQVVDWALADGLYVMIDLHHDSWTWLSSWNGDESAVEYKTYVDLWTQLANTFKDEPNKLCFETINEPQFNSDTGSITKQDKLDLINSAAYNVIRSSGGNNSTRMIVIPTMSSNYANGNSNTTYNFISSLNDQNIIATVHYYSDWVYSGNLGKTDFDEVLWNQNDGSNYTARTGVEQFYNTIYNTFTAKGIGVIIGEYGLLAPDSGPAANQAGEKIKYFELMNYLAQENGICLMLWQNIIDRNDTQNYSWNPPLLGNLVQASLNGNRSSYATGLNETYLSQPTTNDVPIQLTLNGNNFTGIQGLTLGTDYTYNTATSTVTLLKSFVNSKFNTLASNQYGTFADLDFQFSQGSDWHQYLIKYAAPILSPATGTTSNFIIPVNFNGANLRRASAYDASGNRIGPNSWWPYCQFGGEFSADYNSGNISISSSFFNDSSVKDGTIKFTFEFYDGEVINYTLVKSGTNITGIGATK
jgi:endoglucanase